MMNWRKVWRGGAVAGALMLGAALTVAVASPVDAANPLCYVNGDGSFQCGNTAPTPIHERPMFGPNSPTVDILRSNPSWFSCWLSGAWNGSNYIWYGTYGDDTGEWGSVPATMVFTPNDPFVDSSGRHVRHC
jgi:hypothetical protein